MRRGLKWLRQKRSEEERRNEANELNAMDEKKNCRVIPSVAINSPPRPAPRVSGNVSPATNKVKSVPSSLSLSSQEARKLRARQAEEKHLRRTKKAASTRALQKKRANEPSALPKQRRRSSVSRAIRVARSLTGKREEIFHDVEGEEVNCTSKALKFTNLYISFHFVFVFLGHGDGQCYHGCDVNSKRRLCCQCNHLQRK